VADVSETSCSTMGFESNQKWCMKFIGVLSNMGINKCFLGMLRGLYHLFKMSMLGPADGSTKIINVSDNKYKRP